MPKLSDVTVEINARLSIDRRTAETCLRLVEIFCNDNSMRIIGHRMENGETEYSFELEPFPALAPGAAFPKITEDALAAIGAIGAKTHREERQ